VSTKLSEPNQRGLALADGIVGAGHVLQEVLSGKSLTQVLEKWNGPNKPAVQSLAYDTIRFWALTQHFIEQLIPKRPTEEVEGILAVAVALLANNKMQSKNNQYPIHTIVNEAVKAAANNSKTKFAQGFMNAVLRKIIHALDEDETLVKKKTLFFPQWWLKNLRRDYPSQWELICAEQSKRPPQIIRVNQRSYTKTQYCDLLNQAKIEYRQIESIAGIATDDALEIINPLPVKDIPEFNLGKVSIQDAGAQIAVKLLAPQAGEKILDACAAPGGKTAHLLESADIDLLSLDIDPERIKKINQDLTRLNLSASRVRIVCGDASKDNWWDQKSFDKILLDLPCSASGIVRRHPDITLLRRKTDVLELQARQRAIIHNVWKMLRPGGTILLVTCSIFAQEGEEQAKWLEAQMNNALRLESPGQIIPGPMNDGFFYALFEKKNAIQRTAQNAVSI